MPEAAEADGIQQAGEGSGGRSPEPADKVDATAAAEGRTPDSQSESDTDKDALDVLPLRFIPLETKALQRARLIKNMQLDGVIEVFRDQSTGSGQLRPDQLPRFFNWQEAATYPDLRTIRRLAPLNSYDVYSLRIELRRLDIPVNDVNELRLSKDTAAELTQYMKIFTEPLIQQVYGGSNTEISDFSQLIAMFQRPNKEEALRNLRKIAEKLKIELIEVPQFIEDYGDVFLSLAYFKDHLDRLVPKISTFLDSAVELQQNFQLRHDRRFMDSCRYMEEHLTNIVASITGRFESFNRHTHEMWQNITAESFRKVRTLITGHHTTVGGVLCGLSVKMRSWERKFGNVQDGRAVLSRAEFLMGEMRQGMEKIARIEASAPKMADLN